MAAKKARTEPEEEENPEKGHIVNTAGPKIGNPHCFHEFKGYNLETLEVPIEAWPQPGRTHHGSHGYTITAENGAVTGLYENKLFIVLSVYVYLQQ